MVSAVPQRATRIDPRVTRTRALIREALTSLLNERSFDAISVQDVAERATINRATFYAHYADKFVLLDTLIRENIAARLAQGDPLGVRGVPGMLHAVGGNVFGFVASKRKCRIDRDFESQLQRSMEMELADFLGGAFDRNAAMLIASALVGAAMHWRRHTPNSPTEPIVTNIVELLVNGVRSKKTSPR